MGQYGLELRQLIENGIPIFDFDYDMFDDGYKKVFERKFIDTYYFHEICVQSPDRWKHYLRTHLQNVLPYYNQRYKSCMIRFNPLLNELVSEGYVTRTAVDRLTDYGSVLRGLENLSNRQSSKFNETEETGLNTDTVDHSEQVDKEVTESQEVIHQDDKGAESTQGTYGETVDTETDTNTDTTGHSESRKTGSELTETEGNTSGRETSNGTTEVTGTSDQKTNQVAKGTSTSTTYFSDTPQAQIPTTPQQFEGGYWTTHTNVTGTTENTTDTTDHIDTKTDTETSNTKNSTGQSDETKDRTYTESLTGDTTGNETSKSTSHADKEGETTGEKQTTASMDRQTDFDKTVDYNSDVDQTGNIKTDTDRETNNKQSSQLNTDRSTQSNLATAEKRRQGTDTEHKLNIGGFRGITPSELIMRFRDSFINVDAELLADLQTLFRLVL